MIWYMWCMRWSCFVIFHDLHVDEFGNRQEPYGCILILSDLRVNYSTPCNCFTLSLIVSNSCSCDMWWRQPCTAPKDLGALLVEWWRSCRCVGDGDQRLKEKGYTISHIKLHVMFILFMHLILLSHDGSIIRWSLTLNIKIKVFSLSVQRCERSSFRSTTWWSGVTGSTFTYDVCKPVLHMWRH